MKNLWLTAKLDVVESLRARWFMIYTLVFGGIVSLVDKASGIEFVEEGTVLGAIDEEFARRVTRQGFLWREE